MKPAVTIGYDGTKYWYINGLFHREDGPAVEYANGDKHWYINGVLHRENGPAIEYPDGKNRWFTNGEEITKEVEKDIRKGIFRSHTEWTKSDLIKFKLKYA